MLNNELNLYKNHLISINLMKPTNSISEQSHSQQLSHTNQQHPYTVFNTIRVHADNSDKKSVTMFWLIFALLQIIVLVTSNFTPQALIVKTNKSQLSNTKHQLCQNPVQFNNNILSCQDFNTNNPKLGLIMRNLSPLNQFAQINLLYIPKKNQKATMTVKQSFSFQIMSLNKKYLSINQNQKVMVFQKGQIIKKIDRVQFNSAENTLQLIDWFNGTAQKGYDVKLGFYRQFVSQDALLIIKFLDLDKQQLSNYQILPAATLMNPNYTKFVLILRGVFLGITSIGFIFFFRLTKMIIPIIQQKAVLLLSGAVLIFNDPYYIISVFKPNIFSIFISTTFIATFIITVILSWIFMLQKIKTQSEKKVFEMRHKRKIYYGIISSVFFIIIFIFNFQIGYYAFSQSPIIPIHSLFNKLYVAVIILFALLFMYIAWLYFSIIKNWGELIWRHKIYLTFNIFFIVLNMIFISLGWFSFYEQSSQKFEIFYASMNLYVLYMQYMYSSSLKPQVFQLNEEQVNEVGQTTQAYEQKIIEGCITIELDQKQKQYKNNVPIVIQQM